MCPSELLKKAQALSKKAKDKEIRAFLNDILPVLTRVAHGGPSSMGDLAQVEEVRKVLENIRPLYQTRNEAKRQKQRSKEVRRAMKARGLA